MNFPSTSLEDPVLRETLDQFFDEFSGRTKEFSKLADFLADFLLETSNAVVAKEEVWCYVIERIYEHCQREPEIYVDLFVNFCDRFIKEADFQSAVYYLFMQWIVDSLGHCSEDVENEGPHNETAFCEIVSKIAVKSWPPPYRSCIRKHNSVLHSALTAVFTWIDRIERILSGDELEFGAHYIDAETAEHCCANLINLCYRTGRQLWLHWPELVDSIHVVIEKAIISNKPVLQEKTKRKLLALYVKIGDYSKNSAIRKSVEGKSRDVGIPTEFNLSSVSSQETTTRPKVDIAAFRKLLSVSDEPDRP